VLKCFDDELNEISSTIAHSATTPPVHTSEDGHCARQSFDIHKHCPSTDSCWTEDNAPFTSYRANKSSYNTRNECPANLLDVQECDLKAGSCQQTTSTTCSVPSVSTQPKTNVTDLDDDVRWFFEDASDANDDCNRQTVGDVFPLLFPLDNVADVDLESDSKMHKITSQARDSLPFLKDVDVCEIPTLNACSDCSGQHMSESLFINNSPEFCEFSVLNTNNCASVRSTQNLLNAVQPNSDNRRLLLVQKLQETDTEVTDKESTATLPRFGLTAVPEELKSSFPPPVVDPKNREKRPPSNNNVSNKHSSRILSYSRHFKTIQNAVCSLSIGEDDLSDKIMSVDANDCYFDSAGVSLIELSADLGNAEASKSKQLAEVSRSCIPQQTIERVLIGACEQNIDREQLGYFNRLEMIGMFLSHGDDEMMRLAIEICHRQLTLNPTHTWFVI